MPEIVKLTQQGKVGILALDHPPVNALSHALRSALCARLAEALARPEMQAIVLYCEGRTFIAGADIREFGKEPQPPDVPEVVEAFDAASKPVIAAIHGTALGGGLELALACHFRVATPTAKLGFPEVLLGILPGGGGTQRLPRLVGVRAALELIVGGTPVSAKRAEELGLVDALVTGDLKAGAITLAESIIAERRPIRRASAQSASLDDPALLADFEASIRERCRGLLAPFHCIRAVRAAVELPFAAGLELERELFAELMRSPQAKAQRNVFFAEREVAKVPGLPQDTPLRPVKRVAVLGAGRLGRAVAMGFADARMPVTLVDTSRENLEQGLGLVRQHYQSAVAAGRLDAAEMQARLSSIEPTLVAEDVKNADLVVEAVGGDLAHKREVFTELDGIAKAGAILATTTCWFDIDDIAQATLRPADVLGMHFPSATPGGRLVEIARARRTAPDVQATALGVGRKLGKVAVSVLAHPGFVGERMQSQAFREALCLVEEGALPEQVDRVLYEFGFPLGPFAAAARDGLGGARAAEPELEGLGVRHSEARGYARRALSDQEILERYLYALVNEGARILEEGVAARALDIDMVWVHGYGFPAHHGGPMFYADELGLGRVHRAIVEYRDRLDPVSWVPSPLIERLSKTGGNFYAIS